MSFNEWKINKLIDLSEKIGSGATPRGGSNVYLEEGIPFIRSQNVYNCEFQEVGLVYIDEESAEKLKNVNLSKGDVILNITGDSVARCTILPEKYIGGRVNQHVAIIRTNKKKLNPQFLKYFLVSSSMQAHMLSLAQMGATRAALTKGMIESFEIPTPSIKEQEEIANILSTLDDKIEVNKQICKSLENMAQAIFKQWFVDFEFPNKDGEPYKSSGGEMIESELGMIPKGWGVEEIENISDIQNGFAFKAPEYVDEGIKVLRTLNIGNDGYFNNTDIVFLPQSYKSEKYEKYYFEEFDVALVMVGASIGKIGMILKNTAGGLQNQNMWRFRRKEKRVSQIFIYYTVKQAQNISKNWSTGSARDFYRKDSFRKIKVILPEKRFMDLFEKITKPIFQNISNHACENDELISMRDGLLPKLMSGEIRVPLDEEGDVS